MSTYIKISTLEYPRYPGDIQIDPMGAADYAEVVQYPPPAYDSTRYYLSMDTPEQRDGAWHHVWKLVPIPDEIGAKQVREKRNELLAESDWIVIRAFETNTNIPGTWEVYRQALRDVPQQAGFPWEVIWPTEPV